MVSPPSADGLFDVLGVGHGTEDHVCVVDRPTPTGGKARVREYFVQSGGQVPTALVALQRWGLRAKYLGPVGDDDGGARQLSSLRDEGVDVEDCVTRSGAASQRSFISIDRSTGERTIQWYRESRLALRMSEVDSALPSQARALLLDGEDIEIAIELAGAARREGALVVLDADEAVTETRRLLEVTDVAIVPAGFARRFADTEDLAPALRAICESGPRVAVATLGADGAVAWSDGRVYRQPAFPVGAVDTTSAGDVFHAGFLISWLNGDGVEQTLRFASAAASLTAGRLGGRTSIPTLAAVRELLESDTL